MVVTIFRNRLRPGNQEDYYATAGRMSELAKSMPGYVSHKTFTAEDGERVTIVEFASEADQKAWRTQAEHLQAQIRGRKEFYEEYVLQVCAVVRESRFSASDKRSTADH